MTYKIAVIEDDETIQTELKCLLSGNGYDTFVISDFVNAANEVKNNPPHLIILDVKLPGINGFTLCSQIRSFSDVPIIFVTSCDTQMDELNSIMLGGDAFITKPYNTAILLAKIASLLKRVYSKERQADLEWKGVTLHLESGEVEYSGQKVELTKNEQKILFFLFRNAGTICTRKDIIDYLWDNQLYIDDNTLSVNITRIRDKLSTIGVNDFIKTKHKQGYIL